MRGQFSGLWRHPDFLKLWAGQSVSVFGTMVSGLALPFTAVLTLDATASEMGLLRAAGLVPGFLVGLLAGVWVDRLRRRPTMIGADLGRAALMGSVPLAALLGLLRIEQLYAVAFLVGVLTVFFEVALLSYLPTLVAREALLEGNSKLGASASVAEVAGFGLAGALVQALTAPVAIVIDALSFLFSGLSLGLIRTPEPAPRPTAEGPSVARDIGEGLRLVFGDRNLRAIAGASTTLSLFQQLIGAVFLLYVTRELGIEPLLQGLLYAVGGVTSLVGALLAGRAVGRWGPGLTIAGALLVGGLGNFFLPLAGGPIPIAVAFLLGQQLLTDGPITAFLVTQVSLRQSLAPAGLHGRMNASIRFLDWTAMLVGALLGGLLGDLIGWRATLLIGALGTTLAAVWVLCSPLRSLRSLPEPLADDATP